MDWQVPGLYCCEIAAARNRDEHVITADKSLDARGLKCPLPVLKAKKALGELASGQLLAVLADDPGAQNDFEVLCATTGDSLVESSEADGVLTVVIRRA